MMRWLGPLVVAALAATTGWHPASALDAASITAVGWWSQRPGATPAPKGGFEVALAPNGPLSQAALRVRVDAVQLTTALLELTESEAIAADVASVHACPSANKWTPANPGAWDDAPKPDCKTKDVALTRRATGDWSGDITDLLHLGEVSIVLVPRSAASTQGAPLPYQLEFKGARLIATAPSAPPATVGGGEPSARTTPRNPTVVAAPEAPFVAAGPAPPPVVVAPQSQVAPAEQPTPTAPASESAEEDDGRPWWRLSFFVPLAAAAGILTIFVRRGLRERGIFEG